MTASSTSSAGLEDHEAHIGAQLSVRLESAALEIPLLPEVAATVIADSDEEFDFLKVSEQIHRDQALAGHVLRIANSAALAGRAARIVSLQQALVRLGTRRVKELVLAVVMKTRIFRSNRHAGRARAIWREAAGSACLAREIARQMRRNPETAFLCGLLHTVGKPVVLQLVCELERIEKVSLSEEAVERLIEAHHGAAGRRLVAAWSLPQSVAVAIVHYQTPSRAPAFKEQVMITSAASQLAPGLLAGEEPEELARLPIFSELHLYPEDVRKILETRDRVSAYVEAFE